MNFCAVAVTIETEKLLLASFSFALAIALFLLLLKHPRLSNSKKVAAIYGHLTALFFPFALFSTEAACGFLCLPCGDNAAGLALLALPTTLIASTLAGFVVIPTLFILTQRKRELQGRYVSFVRAHAQKLNVREPRLYVVNKARPVAFSFRSLRPSIFVSVGLFDVLKPKEIEAVLLHELAHLQLRSSAFKLSAALMRLSPFALLRGFTGDLNQDEQAADRAVVQAQKTGWHLTQAKRKVNRFR